MDRLRDSRCRRTNTHDPTEHDVTRADVTRYEQAIGAKTVWIYFSDNWFESRKFPADTCNWIRDLGKIPYVRLMLRSDVDQRHAEKKFSLQKIVAGDFDVDSDRLHLTVDDVERAGPGLILDTRDRRNGTLVLVWAE